MFSNPLTEERLERMGVIAGEVCLKFGENFLISLPAVLMNSTKDASDERKTDISATQLQGVSRPRKQYVPTDGTCEKIYFSIKRWSLENEKVDPYATYIIYAAYGDSDAIVKRRYTDFKRLNKKLKKFIPKKTIKLPPAASKFGVRNLLPEFLDQRIADLTAYLNAVCALNGAEKQDALLVFFGLKNELETPIPEVFDEALTKTKSSFGIPGTIAYDSPAEGLSKLISIKIFDEMWEEMEAELPSIGFIKKTVKKAAMKGINKAIEAVVVPAWEKAMTSTAPIREKVNDAIKNSMDTFLTKKEAITNKIRAALASSLSPIIDPLRNALDSILPALAPVLIAPFAPIVRTYYEIQVQEGIRTAIKESSVLRLDEIGARIQREEENAASIIMDTVDKAIDSVINPYRSMESLMCLMNVFGVTVVVLCGALNILEPSHWINVLKEFVKYKDEILALENADQTTLSNKLDEVEFRLQLVISRESAIMRGSARHLELTLNVENDPLGNIPEILGKSGRTLANRLLTEVMMFFVKSFTDDVWGMLAATADPRSFKEKVDGSVDCAFESASRMFAQNLREIIGETCISLFTAAVVDGAEKSLDGMMESVTGPLTSEIPEMLKEMLNLKGMFAKVVSLAIQTTIQESLERQKPIFARELAAQAPHPSTP